MPNVFFFFFAILNSVGKIDVEKKNRNNGKTFTTTGNAYLEHTLVQIKI